jgi:hypothetical protein
MFKDWKRKIDKFNKDIEGFTGKTTTFTAKELLVWEM